MRVALTVDSFEKQLVNIAQYSLGFLEGVQRGKKVFLNNLGKATILSLGQYIDVEAKADRSALHHVYEWYQTGSPAARLFDIDYTVSNVGLSVSSTFRQSRTVQADSNTPFYNKARIMEEGIPVVIKPKANSVLRFYEGGETIFVKKPITVRSPGGEEVQGSFERVFDEFMTRYFTQGFLRASGLFDYIKKPKIFKQNIAAGAKRGKSKGISTGYKWITNAKIEVE
jgi:hypothetical protein